MLAGRAKQRLVLQVTAQIWCQVVNYSSDGGQSCWKGRVSAKSGSLSIDCVHLGPQKLSVIRSSGMSAIQGLLKYWSEWKDRWDFQNCPLNLGAHFSGVSVKRGSTVQTSMLLIKKRPACLTCALQHASTARIGCFSVNHYSVSVWLIQQFYVWRHKPNTEYNIRNHVATKNIYVGSI